MLVHCSDGWDRTAQLCALAQFVLDPYYRTIEGFRVLVEKDWCAMGHMFRQRGGLSAEGASELSPIFLQARTRTRTRTRTRARTRTRDDASPMSPNTDLAPIHHARV